MNQRKLSGEKILIFLARQVNGVFPFIYPGVRAFRGTKMLSGILAYLRDYSAYRSAEPDEHFRISLIDSFPFLYDRFDESGSLPRHYFIQDVWAARKVRASGVQEHYDFGSRIDGFVAHCLSFCTVRIFDIRPLSRKVEGLEVVRSDITRLDSVADGSVASLSSLHAVEHVGLGRYGDTVDPTGYQKALCQLERILAPAGSLYVSAPVGRERLEFNGHRVFAPTTIPSLLADCDLVEFSLINDSEELIRHASYEVAAQNEYACGLYHFVKRAGARAM